MKKVLVLLVAIAAISTSCSKNDKQQDNPKKQLIGKWMVQSIATSEQNGLNECSAKSWVEFTQKTMTTKEYYKTPGNCSSKQTTLDYTVEGNTIHLKGLGKVNFSIAADKLTLKSDNRTVVYKKE